MIACAGAALVWSSAAQCAARTYAFHVPPGPLGSALATFGRQAGVSIGSSDPALASIRVRGIRGNYSLEQGLTKLLSGTSYTYRIVDAYTVRILRSPERPKLPSAARRARPEAGRGQPQAEIVVTASKRPAPLRNFPGSALIVSPDALGPNGRIEDGTSALVDRVPSLFSTSLGRGRNKLFIRGIADSSFSGPTQATVGEYFGDVRMTYNAPDPDLSLYDVDRIELLEGPQGTLYGAGTLGGIMHIIPTAPDVENAAAEARTGLSLQLHGQPGYDLAGMANVPLARGRAAVRLVGYTSLSGGYIDNPERHARDVNDVRVSGGRASLRVLPGDWEIELGGVLQDVEGEDSQYVQGDPDRLVRSTAEPEPFSNRYMLWRAVAKRSFSWGTLTSAAGYVTHRLDSTYSTASGSDEPATVDERSRIRLVSQETRISSSSGHRFNWVAGVSLLLGSDRFESHSEGETTPAIGVRNETLEAAIFGEASVPLSRDLIATAGGRFSFTRLAGEPTSRDTDFGEEPRRTQWRVLPTFALAWRSNRNFGAYLRYQQGFRAGGLSVRSVDGVLSAQPFEGDKITSIEGGLRLGRDAAGPLRATLSLSYSDWRDVQADLISPSGQPFTENIGSGQIYAFEGSATWTPMPNLTAEVYAFLSKASLDPSEALDIPSDAEKLPNIPRANVAASVRYGFRPLPGARLEFQATARYIGENQLGVGPLLDVPQGEYLTTSLGAKWIRGRTEFTFDASNLLDSKGNRFSYGNPFTLSLGRQYTPLRPLTVRIGISRRF